MKYPSSMNKETNCKHVTIYKDTVFSLSVAWYQDINVHLLPIIFPMSEILWGTMCLKKIKLE